MAQTREELRNEIRRNFGWPLVKVELKDEHINDAISRARNMYIKWATGNATKEVYFTMLLKEGQRIYDLPSGVTDVIDYIERTSSDSWPGLPGSGINTLFTFDNYMYNSGVYDAYFNNFDHISLYIAKDFLNTISMFRYEKYSYRYHKHKNQLEIFPVPTCGDINVTSFDTKVPSASTYVPSGEDTATLKHLFRTPGKDLCSVEERKIAIKGVAWVLIRAYMIEGSTLPAYIPKEETKNSVFEIDKSYAEHMYEEPWIIEYSTALSKITLGLLRRKFSQFSSIGNTGISLDGSDLVNEGSQEKTELEEKLKLEEPAIGYGLFIG